MIISGASQDQPGHALIGAGAILFFPFATPIAIRVYRTRRSTPPTLSPGHCIDNEGALSIPRWKWFSVFAGLFIIAVTFAGVLMLYALTFPDSAEVNYRLRSPIVAPLLIVAIAIGVWLLARLLSAAQREKGLWLTPSRVHLSDGLIHQSVAWEDIVDVQAAAKPRFATIKLASRIGAVEVARNSVWARKKNRTWLIEIFSLEFDMDSALLYHTIHYYWKHPELREELGSRAAINRVRRGDVVDSDSRHQGTRS